MLNLHPLEKEAFTAKASDMEPFLALLAEFDSHTAWFVDKDTNPPATMIASTDPVSAVQWIRKLLSDQEWLAILEDSVELSQSQTRQKEKEKDIGRDESEEIGDGGID